MKKKKQMTNEQSNLLRTLVQVGKLTPTEIINDPKRYPGFVGFSPVTIYRHAKKSITGEQVADRRHFNTGRPSKVTAGDKRVIKRQIAVMREESGTFFSTELQSNSGLSDTVSNSTFRRHLKKLG